MIDREEIEEARLFGNKLLDVIEEFDPMRKLTNAQMMVVSSVIAGSIIASSPDGEEEAALKLHEQLTRASVEAIRNNRKTVN